MFLFGGTLRADPLLRDVLVLLRATSPYTLRTVAVNMHPVAFWFHPARVRFIISFCVPFLFASRCAFCVFPLSFGACSSSALHFKHGHCHIHSRALRLFTFSPYSRYILLSCCFRCLLFPLPVSFAFCISAIHTFRSARLTFITCYRSAGVCIFI